MSTNIFIHTDRREDEDRLTNVLISVFEHSDRKLLIEFFNYFNIRIIDDLSQNDTVKYLLQPRIGDKRPNAGIFINDEFLIVIENKKHDSDFSKEQIEQQAIILKEKKDSKEIKEVLLIIITPSYRSSEFFEKLSNKYNINIKHIYWIDIIDFLKKINSNFDAKTLFLTNQFLEYLENKFNFEYFPGFDVYSFHELHEDPHLLNQHIDRVNNFIDKITDFIENEWLHVRWKPQIKESGNEIMFSEISKLMCRWFRFMLDNDRLLYVKYDFRDMMYHEIQIGMNLWESSSLPSAKKRVFNVLLENEETRNWFKFLESHVFFYYMGYYDYYIEKYCPDIDELVFEDSYFITNLEYFNYFGIMKRIPVVPDSEYKFEDYSCLKLIFEEIKLLVNNVYPLFNQC